ncbi:hypothetical protein [Acinetobacter bohemicus]|uniref:hypothetical protein n=1 Tax=Acinetobacter bohemicus TaxID=1435036 RepID=UPI00404318EE
MVTFIDQCLSGDVFLDEIDNFIDKWHEGEAGEDQELFEYLGMSENEYILWSSMPSILPQIIYARRNHSSIEDVLYENQYKIAARSEKADQLNSIRSWLKKKGYEI